VEENLRINLPGINALRSIHREKNRGLTSVLRTLVAVLTAGLFSFSASASAQTLNACDLNSDGRVDNTDVDLAVNMSLGLAPCTANIIGAGICNIIVVQRVINAIGGTCVAGTAHSVSLSWVASASPNVVGYKVYRGTASGGPYTLLNPAVVSGTTFTDTTVGAGQTYYYAVTAVDSSNNASVYSNEAAAVVPSP
jgi:hypothetical protein